jgi:hypothetical protein
MIVAKDFIGDLLWFVEVLPPGGPFFGATM